MAIAVLRTPAQLAEALAPARRGGGSIALVPTMGALHAGHLSLIAAARTEARTVVASLFVNPAQFCPGEDLGAYPRHEARDADLLESAGCELLYAPCLETMYPPGFASTIAVGAVAAPLEGEHRPGHFVGVATIVAKLLIQCAPDVAVFGEKDYQQLLVIRRLVADLDLPVRIVASPTVREDDGLALSSRNAYLGSAERAMAPGLHRALQDAAGQLLAGRRVADVEQRGCEALLDGGFAGVDYFAVRDPKTLAGLGPGPLDRPARVLAAARLGVTRLIDNLAVGPA